MIYDVAKKMLVTGLGIAVFTKEKADSLIQDWVKEGELSKEEGKELLDTWMKKIEAEREDMRGRIQKEVRRMIDQAGVVSKEEHEALAKRVVALELQIKQQIEPQE